MTNDNKIGYKLFETAEIARFTPEQVRSYDDSLKYYRDLKNSLDTAREEEMIEGIEQVALIMLNRGITVDIFSDTTGLTEQQIETLKKTNEGNHLHKLCFGQWPRTPHARAR